MLEIETRDESRKEFVCTRRSQVEVENADDELRLFHYKGHYSFICDIDRLLSMQGEDMKSSAYGNHLKCPRCLQSFKKRVCFLEHVKEYRCKKLLLEDTGEQMLKQHFVLPAHYNKYGQLNVIKYRPTMAESMHPCVIYADLETFSKVTGPWVNRQVDQNKVASYSFTVITRDGFETPVYLWRAPVRSDDPKVDLAVLMLREMITVASAFIFCKQYAMIPLDDEQERAHEAARECMYCRRNFTSKVVRWKKVHHHNHYTGLYVGPTCHSCNCAMQRPRNVPVAFHNGKGYDFHHILKTIMRMQSGPLGEDLAYEFEDAQPAPKQTKYKNLRVSHIQQTGEKYLGVRFGPLLFKDSAEFLKSTLENLIENYTEGTLVESFPHLSKHHSCLQPDNLERIGLSKEEAMKEIVRKIPMPFQAMQDNTCWAKPALFPREAYYNELKREECSEEKYAEIRKTCEIMRFETFGEYHDCYAQTDLIIADIFEKYRDVSFARKGLDPIFKWSAPGVAWDGMLKATGVKIEHITEANVGMEFQELIEENIVGGLSCIFQPYAKANNPHVEHYDPTKEDTYALYNDLNSQYPTCMLNPLPVGGYRKMELADNMDFFRQLLVNYDMYTGGVRYQILVDGYVPERLHDQWDWGVPTKMNVTSDMLSPYSRFLGSCFDVENQKESKIVPWLGTIKRRLFDLHFLQFLVRLGFVVIDVHDIWYCRAEPFMKPWVQENADRRAASTSKVEQDSIKLDSTSIYGKTLQNKKKLSNNEIYANVKQFEKAVQKFNVVDYNIIEINEDSFFGIVSAVNTKGIVLDTPRLIGFTVLEDARALIMGFHYYVVKVLWNSAKLLFTDTDSAMHMVATKDPIGDMLKANASRKFDVKFDLSPLASKLLADVLEESGLSKSRRKLIVKAAKTRKSAEELSTLILEGSSETLTSSKPWNDFMGSYDGLNEYQGVLGAVKEESLPLYMSEYCGCQSKMYATKTQDLLTEAEEGGERKGKGIKKHIVKKLLFEVFAKAVREPYELYLSEQLPDEKKKIEMRHEVEFHSMRFRKHAGGVEAVRKKGITAYNDKVWALSSAVSRPLGHWRNLEPGKEVVSKQLGRYQQSVGEVIELEFYPFADVE